MLVDYVHVLFDLRATHSFVIPEVVSSFKGTFIRVKVGVSIRTPRNHNLHADSCVLGIPIHVGSMVYPTYLLVVRLGQHEVTGCRDTTRSWIVVEEELHLKKEDNHQRILWDTSKFWSITCICFMS